MSIAYLDDQSVPDVLGLIRALRSDALFLVDQRAAVEPAAGMWDRMRQILVDAGAGIVFSDVAGRRSIDYQAGSIRDDFGFGPVIAIGAEAARSAIARYGEPDGNLEWGALYDLRLKIATDFPIVRIPEAL